MKTSVPTKTLGHYEISGARAIDGDTIECVIHLPFQTLISKRVRLAGFWAAELHGPDPAAGQEAKRVLQTFLSANPCTLFSRSERLDKYGRVIATLFSNGKPVDPGAVLGLWQLTEAQHKAQSDAARLLRLRSGLAAQE